METAAQREELSWDLFGIAGRELASTIDEDGSAPDLILSIARGGLFVAGARGYPLDVKNLHVWKRTDRWINFPWSVQPPVVRRTDQVLDA